MIRGAAGGTLFLDEIGEVGLDVQPKLLRFLESSEVHPLGEPAPVTVDVRVVAATNADLDRLVAEGKFREDLFYRLNVVRLTIPPLRERREEIPLLLDHFLERTLKEAGKTGLRIAESTSEFLLLYAWPGNVRELANEVRRMVALAESGSVVMPEHLSPKIAATRRTVPVGGTAARTHRAGRAPRSAAQRRGRARRARAHPGRPALTRATSSWRPGASGCRARASISSASGSRSTTEGRLAHDQSPPPNGGPGLSG